jgi:hypothetical protein
MIAQWGFKLIKTVFGWELCPMDILPGICPDPTEPLNRYKNPYLAFYLCYKASTSFNSVFQVLDKVFLLLSMNHIIEN